MPIPPPTVTAPYDSLESVLNVARTRINDAIQSIGGDILTDTQPFTAVMVNSAWRKLQGYLANMGYSRLKQTFKTDIGVPAVASTDPASQTYWSWSQFYDGAAVYVPPTVPGLPQDLILPLRMWERPASSGQVFRPMAMAVDGLPQGYKTPWNVWFEWREDAIYMPGSTISMEFRVEYAAYLGDFASTGGVLNDPNAQSVPIMRSQSALANYLCAEFCSGRDDADTARFTADAQADASIVFNNDVKLKQRTPVQRRPYARRGNPWRLNSYAGY